jgi:hypothetical protein
MNHGERLNALDALGLDESAPSIGRVRAARRIEEDRNSRRPIDPITRADYRCACGAPAAVRIVHPTKDITQSAPCFLHMVEVITDYFINEHHGAAPRLQAVVSE